MKRKSDATAGGPSNVVSLAEARAARQREWSPEQYRALEEGLAATLRQLGGPEAERKYWARLARYRAEEKGGGQ